jgi:hypothetical protein
METEQRNLPALVTPPSEQTLASWRHQVKAIQRTPAVPEQFRNKPNEIFAVWLMGREIGIPPMRALHLFDVIDGRVAPRAELLTTLATRAGHKIEGDANPEQATARGVRGDTGAEMVVTVTMEEMSNVARRGKKLVDGDNWKNYPSDMLWARAVSRLVRRLCPDVLSGSLAVYQSDDMPATLSQEVIEAPALDFDESGDLAVVADESGAEATSPADDPGSGGDGGSASASEILDAD